MSWPPDPKKVARHDRRAHKSRRGQRYNARPPRQRPWWWPCSVVALLLLGAMAGAVYGAWELVGSLAVAAVPPGPHRHARHGLAAWVAAADRAEQLAAEAKEASPAAGSSSTAVEPSREVAS